MLAHAWALGCLGAVVASISAAFIVRGALGAGVNSPLLRPWIRAQPRLQSELRFVRASLSPGQLQLLQLILFFCAVYVLCKDIWWGLGASILIFLPSLWLKSARTSRVVRIEAQIEGWLGTLARALEATPSLGDALEVSSGMCDAPLSEELAVIVNEVHLGRPLERALRAWSERVGSRTLDLALSTIHVGQKTGGGLGGVLQSAADSLREMERLEGVLRTKTAEGRAQAVVISVIPVPLYFAVHLGDPQFFQPLETTGLGHILLVVAASLWMAAIFFARKILAVEI